MAMNMGTKHETLIENEVIGKHSFQRRVQMFQSDFGEKPQPTHIDAKNRNASLSSQTCRIEHGPVAAQDQQNVGLSCQLSFLNSALLAEKSRRRRIQQHIDVSSP